MGRYGASELMRNKNLQKKAVDYGMKKLSPYIEQTVGTAMDELSTKVRPNKKYKTHRADLDGKGVDIHNWIGKLPRPKAGWTPGKYKYMGAFSHKSHYSKIKGGKRLLNELLSRPDSAYV